MKVFLDDIRIPMDCIPYMYRRIGKLNPIYLTDWKIVRNYDAFVKCVEENYHRITHVSFDHDLADEHYDSDKWGDAMYEVFVEKTGLECAKWLKDFYEKNETDLPTLFVHSMNPIGTQNIINVFK